MRGCSQTVWSSLFFSSRRRHTRLTCDWSSDVCSSDLLDGPKGNIPSPFIFFLKFRYKVSLGKFFYDDSIISRHNRDLAGLSTRTVLLHLESRVCTVIVRE